LWQIYDRIEHICGRFVVEWGRNCGKLAAKSVKLCGRKGRRGKFTTKEAYLRQICGKKGKFVVSL